MQNFLTYVLHTSFMYQEEEKLWTSNYRSVQERLVRYYDVYNCELIENGKPFLTNKGQRENDEQKIRELFKQMLDIAAKATEEKNPEMSIMFDEIGLVLASDYVEAVSKIFSMFWINALPEYCKEPRDRDDEVSWYKTQNHIQKRLPESLAG